jgi:N6-adenosine-specific RNA methylase IME4
MNNERVTLAHAAAHVGFHLNTIKAWRKANELKSAVKLVEKGVEVWYVDLEEVAQVAAHKRVKQGTQPPEKTGYPAGHPVGYPTTTEQSERPEIAVTLRPDAELFLQAVERAVEKAVIPLNENIKELSQRNEELSAKAAKYEERSANLEEHIKQLEAAQLVREALHSPELVQGTQLGTQPLETPVATPQPSKKPGLLDRVFRIFGF